MPTTLLPVGSADSPAPAFTPRTVSPAEWLAAFVEDALATVPVQDIHALVDRVAAQHKAVAR